MTTNLDLFIKGMADAVINPNRTMYEGALSNPEQPINQGVLVGILLIEEELPTISYEYEVMGNIVKQTVGPEHVD